MKQAAAAGTRGAVEVLFINPVGEFSGATRSLLDLLEHLPAGRVRARIVAARGTASAELLRRGYAVLEVGGIAKWDMTRFAYYRGLRWLVVLRELCFLPLTAWAMLRARRRWPGVQIIHVNEITGLPAALLAKALYRTLLVVHVRSVQVTEAASMRRAAAARVLRRWADAIVAIDETVRASLPRDLGARVVHNGFSDRPPAADPEALGTVKRRFHDGSLRVGMVGPLLGLKGIEDFLRAARICCARGANIDFVVAGTHPRGRFTARLAARLSLGAGAHADIERFVAQAGIGERVHLLGFIAEVAAVYRALDVVCFPSHLDAVGRPVIEAAWFGIPSVAALTKSTPDTFVEGQTGLRVPPRDPDALAAALLRLEQDRDEVRRLGAGARRLAQRNFDSRRNAARILALYEELTVRPS